MEDGIIVFMSPEKASVYSRMEGWRDGGEIAKRRKIRRHDEGPMRLVEMT